MPKWLEPFDDERGLVWRSYNYVRRLNPPRAARFLRAYAKGPSFTRPIFIIGTPRSGTTLTFEILSLHPDLASLGHEGHDMWRFFHHPRKTGWSSDVIDPARADAKTERRFIEAFIRARTPDKPDAARFVEKTLDTTLRVEYVLKLFPDALFVAVHRDPCAVVNSIIDGWNDPEGRFRAYFVPEKLNIPDYPHKHRWCFTLIPGWRDLVSKPIPQIALRQWKTYMRSLGAARSIIPPERLVEIRLNELLESPERTIHMLAQRLDLSMPASVMRDMLERAKVRVNSSTDGPQTGWRDRNRKAIEPLLARIAENAAYAGYAVDPVTGDARPAPYLFPSAGDDDTLPSARSASMR
jgi:hypothetical protein